MRFAVNEPEFGSAIVLYSRFVKVVSLTVNEPEFGSVIVGYSIIHGSARVVLELCYSWVGSILYR